MKNLVIILAILGTQLVFAGNTTKPKMLIVGDSWSMFMCLYNSFHQVLRNEGFAKKTRVQKKVRYKYPIKVEGCHRTTAPGLTTEDFLEDKWKNRVMGRASDPAVKIIFLSIGGNDVTARWHKDMSVAQEDQIFQDTLERLEKIIEYIREVNTEAKIIVSNYDYPNFEIKTGAFNLLKLFRKMGSPEPYRMNSTLVRFASHLGQIREYDKVEFIHHFGLMHYHFGNRSAGLGKKETAEPIDISPPHDPDAYGGELEIESASRSMSRVPLLYQDNYHLSATGYFHLVKHTFQHYLKDWVAEAIAQ